MACYGVTVPNAGQCAQASVIVCEIHEEYGVPPEVLIQDYPLKRTGS
jgi:hypothetical protein